MALYTADSRDRVRDAVDFVELVSARTDLRRAGQARYEGLCPFHDERTPSFGIDPVQKVYYCFGCQASGDLFTFVQETEGVDFKGALELLAERYGVELAREKEDPGEEDRRKRRERLLELLKRTAAYYERYLWESEEAARAREYLLGRGLGEEVLREFRVGYAPSAWDRVLLASRRGGFSEQELYATGLAQRSKENGRPYDRFRSRIMFPLADVRGRVLGFGARAMRDEQRPKYLNTSDNDVYHKGSHLYGADLARAHAAKADEVIVCEGYTDTLALHQAGIRNTVGLMGTALTLDQLRELARMAKRVLLALDADSAGQEAMLRGETILRTFRMTNRLKLELRVVVLPENTDPAELIGCDGVDAMRSLVSGSVPFPRFHTESVLARGDHGTAEGRERMVRDIAQVFAQLGPGTMQLELVELVSNRLSLSESLTGDLLERATTERSKLWAAPDAGGASTDASSTVSSPLRQRLSRREDPERAFLALCIAFPDEGARALADVDVDEHFASELLRRAARRLRDSDLRAPMRDVPGQAGALDDDPELKGLLAELVVQSGREERRPAMLEAQRLQLELAHVERQIQRARMQKDGQVGELAKRKVEVKLEFDRATEQVMEGTGER